MQLRQHIARDGRFVRSESVDRGDMLLMDVDGWARRAWSTEVSLDISVILLSLTVCAAISFFIFVISSGTVTPILYLAIFLSNGIFCALNVSMELGGLWMASRETRRGPGVPGLYSKGIQTSIGPISGGYFIPYQEIDRIRQHRLLFLDMFDIFIKGKRFRASRLPTGFLGEEGLGILREMAGREPEPIGSMKLILYAPPDSPLASRPRDGTADATGTGMDGSATFPQGRY